MSTGGIVGNDAFPFLELPPVLGVVFPELEEPVLPVCAGAVFPVFEEFPLPFCEGVAFPVLEKPFPVPIPEFPLPPLFFGALGSTIGFLALGF